MCFSEDMIAESNLVYKPDFYISDADKVLCELTARIEGTLREPGIVPQARMPLLQTTLGLALLKTLGTVPKIQMKLSLGSAPDQKGCGTGGLGRAAKKRSR